MGIPGFFAWLKSKYGRIILKKGLYKTIREKTQNPTDKPIYKNIPLKCRTLSIDGNAVLHPAAKDSEGDTDIIVENYTTFLREVLEIVSPYRLSNAFDGVAPVGKIQQQWIRRWLSARGIQEDGPPIWDSALLSPGTPLMDEIDMKMRKWFKNNLTTLPKEVVYLPHRLAGEGEHKLFDEANFVPSAPKLGERNKQKVKQHQNDVDVLYSPDADVILISMLRSNNMFIMREKMEHEKEEEKDNDDEEEQEESKRKGADKYHFLDVEMLKRMLKEEYDISPEDFVILVTLVGNDFVPATPIGYGVRDCLSTCLLIYKRLRELKSKIKTKQGIIQEFRLYNNNKLQLNDFYSFIDQVSKQEEKLLLARKRRETHSQEFSKTSYMNPGYTPIPIVETYLLNKHYKVINNQQSLNLEAFRDDYYNYILPGTELRGNRGEVMLDLVDSYLEAFTWIITYYTKGLKAINVEWFYRYHYAPLILEIKEVLKILKDTQPERWIEKPLRTNGVLLNPLEQQIAILPVGTLNYVLYGTYTFTQEFITRIYIPLVDKFPEEAYIDIEGRNIPEKAIVSLPFVDIERIRQIAKDLNREDLAGVEKKSVKAPFKLYKIKGSKRTKEEEQEI